MIRTSEFVVNVNHEGYLLCGGSQCGCFSKFDRCPSLRNDGQCTKAVVKKERDNDEVSKDARIAELEFALKQAQEDDVMHSEVLGEKINDLIDRSRAYESALAERERECERRYTHEEVALWLSEYHGRYREKTLVEWVAERRAVLAALRARDKQRSVDDIFEAGRVERAKLEANCILHRLEVSANFGDADIQAILLAADRSN